MKGVAFEIITTCERCGAPLPLNAVYTHIPWGQCGEMTILDAEEWTDVARSSQMDRRVPRIPASPVPAEETRWPRGA